MFKTLRQVVREFRGVAGSGGCRHERRKRRHQPFLDVLLEKRELLSTLVLPQTSVPNLRATYVIPGTVGEVDAGAQLAGGNFLGTLDGTTSLAASYCVSIDLGISVPDTYNATVTNDGTIFGASVPNAGAISWLITNLGASATTGDQQDALQAAIWRMEYGANDFQLDGADNNSSSGNSPTLIADYQADLAALGSNTAPPGNVLWISPTYSDSTQAQGLVALPVAPQRSNELIASPNPNGEVFSVTTGQATANNLGTIQTLDPNAVVTGLTARIDNGPGTPIRSATLVRVGPGQVWQIFDPYPYNTRGSFPLNIHITDDQGDSATLQGQVTVVATTPTPTPTPTPSPTPTPTSIQVSIQQIEQIIPPATAPPQPGPHATAKVKQAYAKKLAQYLKTLNVYNQLAAGLVNFLNSTKATVTDQINNRNRQAAFIGQVAVETGYLTTLTQQKAFGTVGTTDIGEGYLQITGKKNYSYIAKKFLHVSVQETLKLLATNPQVAASVSGYYWKGGTGVKNINHYADLWDIKSVSQLVNAGRVNPRTKKGNPVKINNLAERLIYSQRALDVLNP